jgi:hypothetical protein
MRRVLSLGAGGTVLSASLTAGWLGMALSSLVVVTLTLALCWIVADSERSYRLILLVKAWRGTSHPGMENIFTYRKSRNRRKNTDSQ